MKRRTFNGTNGVAVSIAAAILGWGALPAGAAVDACTQLTSLTGGTTHTSDGSSTSGVGSGYEWELSHDGGGSVALTTYGKDAAFKAEWDDPGNFLAQVGYKWNASKTFDAYGNVVADYAFVKSGNGAGYSYIGIHGWTKNPLVEYYIVEDWFGTTPPNMGGTLVGTLDVDGGTYKIYKNHRIDEPSILGLATFWQFIGVRQTPRPCGHVSVSKHWKKWMDLDMQMGDLYEAKILVEAGGGKGTFDLSYATMQVDAPDVPTTSVLPAPRLEPLLSNSGNVSLGDGKAGTLSLVSLNGSVLRSARQEAGRPTAVSTANLAKGVYLLRFQGDGSAPETRKFLLD